MPDLVGLAVCEARDVGHEEAVVVVATDVDGPALGALTWPGAWIVMAQDPGPGSRVRKWDNVRISFRRADGDEAGDHEPCLPSPSPDDLDAHATLDGAWLPSSTEQRSE